MFLLILALLSSLLGKCIINFCNNFTIATQIIYAENLFSPSSLFTFGHGSRTKLLMAGSKQNYQDKMVFLGTNILQNLWETKNQWQGPHMQGMRSTVGMWGLPNTPDRTPYLKYWNFANWVSGKG